MVALWLHKRKQRRLRRACCVQGELASLHRCKTTLYTAIEHMLALACQQFSSIGQTDVRFRRDGSVHPHTLWMMSAFGAVGARIGEARLGDIFTFCMNCCSH